MVRFVNAKRVLTTFLLLVFLFGTFAIDGVAGQRRRRYRRVHHSRTKGALVGGAIGGVGGALIGGKKGALIGAGAGAGTGYLIQRHRNKRHRRRY
jgi:osmotically inducible lipoprotein OsmB